MRYIQEFRDPKAVQGLVQKIERLKGQIATHHRLPLQIMEFCGGHTHTIFRYGIEQLLPEWIELIHGPGCPVCVLPRGRVDDCVALAECPDVIFTTFGDAMRVPGSRKSLLQAKAGGADIRMVYSPLDALSLAESNPNKEVIFFGLGFETTMPSTALTVLEAKSRGIRNFSLFCNHITTVPTLKAILESPETRVDGFIAPGHVSMVVGEQPFSFVAQQFKKPIVIAGFEPLDLLQSIYMLVSQFAEQRHELENQYKRVVPAEGNRRGLEAMAEVFELRDRFSWRGLGSIDESGIRMRDTYRAFDAEQKFSLKNARVEDPEQCRCGSVLTGVINAWECPLFGSECTPKAPKGALMVSSEGACAAYYNYGDVDELMKRRVNES